MTAVDRAPITADSKINDVLAKHPDTAPVFTQGRRLYVDQRHELYARFPGLSVGDFARQNGMDPARSSPSSTPSPNPRPRPGHPEPTGPTRRAPGSFR